MDRSLQDATLRGDAQSLRKYLSLNPFLLDPFTIPMQQHTPLHAAALAGHVDFVATILQFKLQMCYVQNEQGMYPIHLATSGGHWFVVASMLNIDRRLGHVIDRGGRTAMHIAAACGRVEVLERLMEYDQSFADAKAAEGETILHTSVRYNQLDAVKAIARRRKDLVSVRDVRGNTVLHLAIARGNRLIVDYLLKETKIDPRVVNELGYTADQMVEKSGTRNIQGVSSLVSSVLGDTRTRRSFRTFGARVDAEQKIMDKEYMRDKHNVILVVATVIAGATFQTGIDHSKEYTGFRFCNTISFGLSVALFILLASGGTLQHWVQTRIVLIILWASLFFMALGYGIFIMHKHDKQISKVGVAFMVVVIVAMLIVLIGHIYVFISYLVWKYKHRSTDADSTPDHSVDQNQEMRRMTPIESPSRPLFQTRQSYI